MKECAYVIRENAEKWQEHENVQQGANKSNKAEICKDWAKSIAERVRIEKSASEEWRLGITTD